MTNREWIPPPTIDVAIGIRSDSPRPDEPPITCAACGKVRQSAGAAKVTITDSGTREDMLPLCRDCAQRRNLEIRPRCQVSASKDITRSSRRVRLWLHRTDS
jgi:hypothetical protein